MRNTRILSLMVFTAAISAMLMYWYMANNEDGDNICSDYDGKNMSTIDVDLVHTMVGTYRDNQLRFIQSNANFKALNDANSIWFDLETLKKFLYHIEHISKKEKNIAPDKLGVRIYYAAYPNLKDNANQFEEIKIMMDDPDKDNYGNVHTLVMIPTIEDGEGNIFDFNPLDVHTYSQGLRAVEAYNFNSNLAIPNSNPNPQTNSIGALSSSDRHTGSRNHGVLSPPAAAPGAGF